MEARERVVSEAHRCGYLKLAQIAATINRGQVQSSQCAQLLCKQGKLHRGRIGNDTRFFADPAKRDAWLAAESPPPVVRKRVRRSPAKPMSLETEDAVARDYPHVSNAELAERYGITTRQAENLAARRKLRKTDACRAQSGRSAIQVHAAKVAKDGETRRAWMYENQDRMTVEQMAAHLGIARKTAFDLLRKARHERGEDLPPKVYHPPKPREPLNTSVAAPKPIPQIVTEQSVEGGVKITRARWVDHRWVEPSHRGPFSLVGIGRDPDTGRAWGP